MNLLLFLLWLSASGNVIWLCRRKCVLRQTNKQIYYKQVYYLFNWMEIVDDAWDHQIR